MEEEGGVAGGAVVDVVDVGHWIDLRRVDLYPRVFESVEWKGCCPAMRKG